MSRRAQLEQLLNSEPRDAFLRYALAMCCLSEEDFDAAQAHFQQLLSDHPDYVAGYFQYAQLHVRCGNVEAAKPLLKSGIEIARHAGDSHSADEMSAFLSSLE